MKNGNITYLRYLKYESDKELNKNFLFGHDFFPKINLSKEFYCLSVEYNNALLSGEYELCEELKIILTFYWKVKNYYQNYFERINEVLQIISFYEQFRNKGTMNAATEKVSKKMDLSFDQVKNTLKKHRNLKLTFEEKQINQDRFPGANDFLTDSEKVSKKFQRIYDLYTRSINNELKKEIEKLFSFYLKMLQVMPEKFRIIYRNLLVIYKYDIYAVQREMKIEKAIERIEIEMNDPQLSFDNIVKILKQKRTLKIKKQ